MTTINQRDTVIDLIKGIGIFCMVAGHSGAPFTQFIYLFHMALFFIVSGYCYKESYSNDLKNVILFIKRKIKTLYFPYVLWSTIYCLLHNFFIKINVYTDNPLIYQFVNGDYISITEPWDMPELLNSICKSFMLHGSTQMGGAFWFLATLMILSIAYCCIGYILNKLFKADTKKIIMAQALVSFIFLFIGFLCYKRNLSCFGLNKVFSYYILFYCGFLIKKYQLLSTNLKIEYHILLFCISFFILLQFNNFGTIDLAMNSYVNPVFFLTTSFLGWQFIYEIAYFIDSFLAFASIIILVGRNTLPIVILHFLSFKLVNYIGVIINKQPLCLVAAFPVLYKGGIWWIIYSLVGITIPVILSLEWKKWKQYYKSKHVFNV